MTRISDQPGIPPHSRLRLTLRALEVFVATARAGSTRAAALEVSRSQSAASSTLAELERQLGVRLFDRIGRRLALNAEGQALLPRAMALLDHAAEVESLLAGEQPEQPLRIAASLTIGEYLLPELVARWKADRPQGAVQLLVGNTAEVLADVLALRVDLGFIEGPQAHAELHTRRWLDDELIVVAAPGHALAGRRRVGARALAAARWILREPRSGTRQAADAWLVEPLSAHGGLRVDFELGSTEAIKRLAAAGAGLACLSRHTVLKSLATGELAEVRTTLPRARRRLAIVTRRGRRLPATAEGFVRHCLALAAQFS